MTRNIVETNENEHPCHPHPGLTPDHPLLIAPKHRAISSGIARGRGEAGPLTCTTLNTWLICPFRWEIQVNPFPCLVCWVKYYLSFLPHSQHLTLDSMGENQAHYGCFFNGGGDWGREGGWQGRELMRGLLVVGSKVALYELNLVLECTHLEAN